MVGCGGEAWWAIGKTRQSHLAVELASDARHRDRLVCREHDIVLVVVPPVPVRFFFLFKQRSLLLYGKQATSECVVAYDL